MKNLKKSMFENIPVRIQNTGICESNRYAFVHPEVMSHKNYFYFCTEKIKQFIIFGATRNEFGAAKKNVTEVFE